MTKLRILFRTGDSIEFPVKDKPTACRMLRGFKYDNTIQTAFVGDENASVASWIGSECVAIVVQESGGK